MKKNLALRILLLTAGFCALFACSKLEGLKKAATTTTTGLNWTQAASLSSSTVHKLVVSGTTIYAATSSGLYSSTNNGAAWTAVNTGLPSTTDVNAIAVGGSNIYAGTGAGLYYSTNNGTSWTATASSTVELVGALAVSGNNLFAGQLGGGVYLSTDNGSTWTAVNSGLPANASIYSLTVSGNNLFAGVAVVNGSGGAPGTGVYLSTNNGGSWTAMDSGLPAIANLNAIAVNGSTLYAGIIGYTSTDVASGSGIYVSTNNGSNWTSVNGSSLPSQSILATTSLAISGNNIFAGIAFSGIYRTTNNGSSWTEVGNTLTQDLSVFSIVIVGNTIITGDGLTSRGVYTATF